jgi:hypothetical protein
MAYGDPQLLHLDSMLTDISVGFDNPDQFVASMLFPQVGVAKQSDRYYVYNRDLWGRVTDDIRAPGSEANELPPMTLSRDGYFAEEHALEDVVPDEEVENADQPLQPAMDATERVTNTILLNREKIMVDIATTTANYASGFTATPANKWNNYTTSDPIADVKTGRTAIHNALFRDPNTALVGYSTAVALEDHPDFIERIKHSQLGIANDDLISQVLGIPQFRRAGAGVVTSVYGQAETFGYLWLDDMVLAYVPPRPGRKVPAYGYEFVWGYSRAGGSVMATERWREERRASDVVRVRRRYDVKLIVVDGTGDSNGAGYLLKDLLT